MEPHSWSSWSDFYEYTMAPLVPALRLRQEDHGNLELEGSLGNTERPCIIGWGRKGGGGGRRGRRRQRRRCRRKEEGEGAVKGGAVVINTAQCYYT